TISTSFSAIQPSFGGGHNEFLCNQFWVFSYNVSSGTTTLLSHLASDQGAGTTSTLSEGTSGLLTGFGNSFGVPNASLGTQATSVSISGDGKYVAYMSTGTHLMVGEQDNNLSALLGKGYYVGANVFVYDRSSDSNYLVSHQYGSGSAADGQTPADYTSYVA